MSDHNVVRTPTGEKTDPQAQPRFPTAGVFLQASDHLGADPSTMTPTADANECGHSRTWADALSAPGQPRDGAGQLGGALQASDHSTAGVRQAPTASHGASRRRSSHRYQPVPSWPRPHAGRTRRAHSSCRTQWSDNSVPGPEQALVQRPHGGAGDDDARGPGWSPALRQSLLLGRLLSPERGRLAD